ncbi:MAG: polysaccharide deacetylase family protein [Nocardioidaceae bacterium]
MSTRDDGAFWPSGYRAAASFSFDVDGESAVLSSNPEAADRLGVMSHQAYGPLVGVPRILRLLARHDVRSTFFVPGYTAVRHPDVVRAIVDGGHEIAHHGFLHESLASAPRATQADYLDKGLAALDEVAGVRPVGYRAPMWEMTYEMPELLLERGFLYDSSLMDADLPYELAVAGDGERAASSLVEIPIHWGLDDWEQYCFIPGVAGSGLIEDPRKAVRMWTDEFEAMRHEGACFVLTGHPFLSGRPARAAALEQLIGRVAECDDVWLAPLGEIAAHARSLGLPPRRLDRPTGFAG